MKFTAALARSMGRITTGDADYIVTSWRADKPAGVPAVSGEMTSAAGEATRFRLELRAATYPTDGFLLIGEAPFVRFDLAGVEKMDGVLVGEATDNWLDTLLEGIERRLEA